MKRFERPRLEGKAKRERCLGDFKVHSSKKKKKKKHLYYFQEKVPIRKVTINPRNLRNVHFSALRMDPLLIELKWHLIHHFL